MATVSSTIMLVRKERWIHRPSLPGKWVLKPKDVPKAEAKAPTMRPQKDDPVLLLDMGHNRYSGRYLHQTLRTVCKSQSKSRRAVVVLSSWHYKNANYEPSWTWPLANEASYVKWTKGIWSQHGDVIDMIEVDLSQARKPQSN
jgi:folylpolyglutamate synthase/dihydropteroate synthase